VLTFVGLGLYDLQDVSVKGLEYIRNADAVYLESYTSRLFGCTQNEMQELYGKEIRVLSRHDIEGDPGPLLECAGTNEVVLLIGGDPMVSTTHIDLRIRAHQKGITTKVIHGSSISSAVCGLTGLQNYRFGKSCSVPFPHGYVGIARAGSDSPVIRAGDARIIQSTNFGPPLHILAIPASLHVMEREYLELFADL